MATVGSLPRVDDVTVDDLLIPRFAQVGAGIYGLVGATAAVVLADGKTVPYLVLMAVAAAPMIYLVVRGVPPWPAPPLLFASIIAAPVVVIHVFGQALGIVELTSGAQYSLMISTAGAAAVPSLLRLPLAAVMETGTVLVPVLQQLVAGGLDAWWFWTATNLFSCAGGIVLVRLQLSETRLRRATELLDREAVAEERRRIAREVHDLVGHALGVVMVHMTAARMAVERGDTQEAVSVLRDAERAGRQGVADIRRTLELLRPAGENGGAPEPALPGVEDIGSVVDTYRAGGMVVELSIVGPTDTLTPATGLTAHRVVQEALTNVARHARGAAVRVSVSITGTRTTVVVSNGRGSEANGPRRRDGLGLVGMRERVRALGGSLRAGPDGEGWLVEAILPGSSNGVVGATE